MARVEFYDCGSDGPTIDLYAGDEIAVIWMDGRYVVEVKRAPTIIDGTFEKVDDGSDPKQLPYHD